jgi:hypothetical protein
MRTQEDYESPDNKKSILTKTKVLSAVLLAGLGIGTYAFRTPIGRAFGSWPTASLSAELADSKQDGGMHNGEYRHSSLAKKFSLTFIYPNEFLGGVDNGKGIFGFIGRTLNLRNYPALTDYGTSPCLYDTAYDAIDKSAAILPGENGDFTVFPSSKRLPFLSLSLEEGNIGQIHPLNAVSRELLKDYHCPGPDQVYVLK